MRILVVALLVVLAAIGLLVFSSGSSPYAVSIVGPALGDAPVLAGRARSALAEATPVVLVDNGGRDVATVGRVEADGTFRVTLPADPGVAQAAAASVATTKAMFARSTTPAATAAPMIERATEHAGHRLRADFATLKVDPPGMLVGHFGLVLARPGTRGDLVATDSDPSWLAQEGERILCWLWADRAGHVSGTAYAPVELDEPRFNTWELDLVPGWNAVSSVQLDDGISLRYETAPVPPGLEWHAIVPDASNTVSR